MSKSSITFYIAIILIIVLPNTFGRFIFNLAGSLLILSIIIPLVLVSLGWITWKVLQSKASQCSVCGATIFSNTIECPLCGSRSIQKQSKDKGLDIAASDATIDIVVEKKID